MNLAKFLESVLIRDLFSYLLPGFLVLLILSATGLDGEMSGAFITSSKKLIGDTGTALIGIGVAYAVGYLLSTLLFYFRGKVSVYRRPGIGEIRPEIIDKLVEVFGEWARGADSRYLAGICLHYVELKSPEFYFEKIERRITLRNLEINLAPVFVTISVAIILLAADWWRAASVIPVLIAHSLLLSSKNIDAAIDRLAFTAFFSSTIQSTRCPKE